MSDFDILARFFHAENIKDRTIKQKDRDELWQSLLQREKANYEEGLIDGAEKIRAEIEPILSKYLRDSDETPSDT